MNFKQIEKVIGLLLLILKTGEAKTKHKKELIQLLKAKRKHPENIKKFKGSYILDCKTNCNGQHQHLEILCPDCNSTHIFCNVCGEQIKLYPKERTKIVKNTKTRRSHVQSFQDLQ